MGSLFQESAQNAEWHLGGRTCHLHQAVAVCRVVITEDGLGSGEAFTAYRAGLRNSAIAHHRHKRDNGIMREIDLIDGSAGFVKDRSALKFHHLESRAQFLPFITVECSKEPISAVEVVYVHWVAGPGKCLEGRLIPVLLCIAAYIDTAYVRKMTYQQTTDRKD